MSGIIIADMNAVSSSLGTHTDIGSSVESQSFLLKYIEAYHPEVCERLVCLDMALYDSLEPQNSFYIIIASTATSQVYQHNVLQKLFSGKNSGGESKSNSILLNETFRSSDCLFVITEESMAQSCNQQLECHEPPVVAQELTQATGRLYRKFPVKDANKVEKDLTASLSYFQQLLFSNKYKLHTKKGQPISHVIGCNYRAGKHNRPSPVGQLFVGVADTEQTLFEKNSGLPSNALRQCITDLGIIMLKSHSVQLFERKGHLSGEQSAQAIFAHETRKLINAVRGMPLPLSKFTVQDSSGTNIESAQKLFSSTWGQAIDLESARLLPNFQYFDAAMRHMLLWTLTGAYSDFPFYDYGKNKDLPATLAELVEKCFEAAKQHIQFFLATVADKLDSHPACTEELAQLISRNLPRLKISGSGATKNILWQGSGDHVRRMSSLVRLMTVGLREAVEHGSWGQNEVIHVSLEEAEGSGSPQKWHLKIRNRIRKNNNFFEDERADSNPEMPMHEISKAKLNKGLRLMHPNEKSDDPRGGQHELRFFVKESDGEWIGSRPWKEDLAYWLAECFLPFELFEN